MLSLSQSAKIAITAFVVVAFVVYENTQVGRRSPTSVEARRRRTHLHFPPPQTSSNNLKGSQRRTQDISALFGSLTDGLFTQGSTEGFTEGIGLGGGLATITGDGTAAGNGTSTNTLDNTAFNNVTTTSNPLATGGSIMSSLTTGGSAESTATNGSSVLSLGGGIGLTGANFSTSALSLAFPGFMATTMSSMNKGTKDTKNTGGDTTMDPLSALLFANTSTTQNAFTAGLSGGLVSLQGGGTNTSAGSGSASGNLDGSTNVNAFANAANLTTGGTGLASILGSGFGSASGTGNLTTGLGAGLGGGLGSVGGAAQGLLDVGGLSFFPMEPAPAP